MINDRTIRLVRQLRGAGDFYAKREFLKQIRKVYGDRVHDEVKRVYDARGKA